MAQLLGVNGFAARTARDGKDALQRLRRGPKPCLLLLDLMMPGMTGWEFLELHRENARLSSIPLVLVTGWLDTEIAQAKAMVPKPVNPKQLLRTLRRVLSKEGDGRKAARTRLRRPPPEARRSARRPPQNSR